MPDGKRAQGKVRGMERVKESTPWRNRGVKNKSSPPGSMLRVRSWQVIRLGGEETQESGLAR